MANVDIGTPPTPKTTLYPKITGKLEDIEYHLARGTETQRVFPVTGTVKLHGSHALVSSTIVDVHDHCAVC